METKARGGWMRSLGACLLLAGLVAYAGYELCRHGSLRRADSFTMWAGTLLLILVIATIGVATERWWARWLGLAAGLTCTMYAGIFTAVVVFGGDRFESEALPFFTGPLLLACLAGRTMFDRFDARAGWSDDRRTRLVRWTAVANLASLASLLIVNLVLLTERSHSVPAAAVWLSVAATLMLLCGVALLARKKTAGVLAMAALVGLQVALLAVFCQTGGTSDLGETGVLLGLFLPGFVTALATFVVYARPMWRFLRTG